MRRMICYTVGCLGLGFAPWTAYGLDIGPPICSGCSYEQLSNYGQAVLCCANTEATHDGALLQQLLIVIVVRGNC